MADRGHQLLAVGIFFTILTWLSVGLRVYVRAFMQRSFALDDWLIVVTLVFYTAYQVCQVGGIVHGSGKHMADLDPRSAEIALQFWWYCEIFYILASSWLKISVGVFLLRVATKRIHIWIIRVMLAGTSLFGTAYWFLAMFQCKPVSAWWMNHRNPSYGTCLGPKFVLASSYTASLINSAADFTFMILPFFIVRHLDMPQKQKHLVAMILAFAGIGCLATIVRLPFIPGLVSVNDFLYDSVDIAIWSVVEPGIGISAACVVTFRPLLQIVLTRPHLWSKYSSPTPFDRRRSKPSQSRSYALSQSMPTLRPDINYVGNYTEITSGGRQDFREPRCSIEMLPTVYSGPGINKKVEVTFSATESNLEDAQWHEIKINQAHSALEKF